MKECMEDKGKGIEGESSRHRHGGRGGRGSRRSRGGRIQHVSTEQIQSDQGNKQYTQTSVHGEMNVNPLLYNYQPATQQNSQTFTGLLNQQIIQANEANLMRQNPQLIQNSSRLTHTGLLHHQMIQATHAHFLRQRSRLMSHTRVNQTIAHSQEGGSVSVVGTGRIYRGRASRGHSTRGRGWFSHH
uniref:Uncharacterized protein n=1 Tax=Meloidogyne javanica TaxID=6303 RepID=A0A915N309_MELJA